MAISTDDYVAISDLLGEYCWRVDDGDEDGWTALWTEDGEFIGFGTQPLVGRAQLAAIPRHSLKSGEGKLRHLVANFHARYGDSSDIVQARLYNYVTNWAKGGAPVVIAVCEMVLVRDGGSWKIKRNDARMLSAG
jgi:3-phenylpropionate/cinnamic acid dioxygenase small subunit